jgi:formamidopyrimidine-DNA glycosylase
MPELPDVEVFRQYFDSTALHQKISEVEIKKERLLEDVSPDHFKQSVQGYEFSGSHRHGKHLFARLNSGGSVVLHFGMTGELKYYKDPADEPDHARVVFHFENGYHLGYDNMRMLGKVALTDEIDDYIEKEKLGPDAGRLSPEVFKNLLGGKRGMIKSAFMDQSLMAGMGNIFSDETLFQSGIHPKRQVGELSENEIEMLYEKMMEVIEKSVECQISDFPDYFLINYRDEDAECPRCGGQVEKIKVSSRSTYLCPNCQN